MANLDLHSAALPAKGQRRAGWMARLVASHGFQRWAARFPFTRRIVRHEGEAMFDLVAGFCHSQVLLALVRLQIPRLLLQNETHLTHLASIVQVPAERLQVLVAAGVSIGVLKQRRNGFVALTTRGAALAGVPGLAGMIDHHDVLYRDLADPVAFFRGEAETELATFWPYVFGAGAASDPQVAQRYSRLMADSQSLVAEDTCAMVNFRNVSQLLDVGGGSGAFLAHVGQQNHGMHLRLFDLPSVVPAAMDRFANAGLSSRAEVIAGSFRDDALPEGADMISLVRVLYDHADETVAALLGKAYASLPPGGRILVSEPMTGGQKPHKAGDAYFALYCMAMGTGRARSATQIAGLLAAAGFTGISTPKSRRPFVTSVVQAVRPG